MWKLSAVDTAGPISCAISGVCQAEVYLYPCPSRLGVGIDVAHDRKPGRASGTARAVADVNGGIAVVINGKIRARLELPIAGLMSNMPLDAVVDRLEQLKHEISGMGANRDILMSLHFIQLAVIPSIKITDLGLVDVMKQELINLSC